MNKSERATIAVYPGTFDPLTLGHEDIIHRAVKIFDKIILAVAYGHHKSPMFSLEERIEMAQQILEPYSGQVSVMPVEGLMADFVQRQGGNVILRGIRAVSDFDYEFQMAGINRHLIPKVETIFMTPNDNLQFISGTFIREISRLGGDVSKFVSPAVLNYIEKKIAD